jgi:hypothetical protein
MQPIIINYNGGKINIEFKQFNQTINLSRKPIIHGQACIIESTSWQKTQTIKPGNYNYYLMSNNNFINIDYPQISEDITDKLIIQIINASKNIKQQPVQEKIQSAKSLSSQTQKLRNKH